MNFYIALKIELNVIHTGFSVSLGQWHYTCPSTYISPLLPYTQHIHQ